jgi:hypothetical protein
MTRGEYRQNQKGMLHGASPSFSTVSRLALATNDYLFDYIFFEGAFSVVALIVIVFILHLLQQYIVLPLTLTARVFSLVFLAVIGMDMPIFLQAGHTTPAGFLGVGLAAGAAEAANPRTPRLKLHAANAVSFFIILLLENFLSA